MLQVRRKKAEGQSETLQAGVSSFQMPSQRIHKSLHLHLTDQVTVRSHPLLQEIQQCAWFNIEPVIKEGSREEMLGSPVFLCRWAGCYRTRDADVGGNQHIGPTLNEDLTASESGSLAPLPDLRLFCPFKTLSFFETQLIWYDTLRKSSLPPPSAPPHSLFFLLVCFSHPL